MKAIHVNRELEKLPAFLKEKGASWVNRISPPGADPP